MADTDLNDDPGLGELNVRARVAATVGPFRVVHGARSVKKIVSDRATKIAQGVVGGGERSEVIFVQVSLPTGTESASILFSSSESSGQNSMLFTLAANPGVYNVYEAILLPGDQLYAQSIDPDLRIVISQVTF